jgi:hypothetical protein
MSLAVGFALAQIVFQGGGAGLRADTIQPAPDEVVTSAAPGLRAGWAWTESVARDRRLEAWWVGWTVEGDTTGGVWYYADRRLPDGDGRGAASSQLLLTGMSGSIGFSGAKPGSLTGTRDPHALAVLLRYERQGDRTVLARVHVGNAVFPLRFGRGPLLWLGPAADAESVDRLAALFASDAPFRRDLVAAVGVHRDAGAAVPVLVRWLERGDTASVRREAAVWLGRHAQPAVIDALTKAAREDPEMNVRRSAIQALGRIRDDRAVRALTAIVEDPGDAPAARKEAVAVIGRRPPRGEAPAETIELLLRAARGDADRTVQTQAVQSLAGLGAVDALRAIAWEHSRVETQRAAVRGLAAFDTDAVRGFLADIAEKHPSADIRRTALQVIAGLAVR